MTETLQEYVDSRGATVRVDRVQGVIRGVKILGLESRNGRSYLPQALREAVSLYEGAKVNVNHPAGHAQSPRDYRDRIGVMRHVTLHEGTGLFGDFCFNPKHPLADQLAWDAEHAPENVGFSHNVQAKLQRQGDRAVVEAIMKVNSVDLVADPATTAGLFEELESARLTSLTLEQLRGARPDLVSELLEEQSAELRTLRAEAERLRLSTTLGEREKVARRLLAEHQLPAPEASDAWSQAVVGPGFFASLMNAPSEQAMRQMVQERAQLVEQSSVRRGPFHPSHKPLSRDQHFVDITKFDAKAFARSIT